MIGARGKFTSIDRIIALLLMLKVFNGIAGCDKRVFEIPDDLLDDDILSIKTKQLIGKQNETLIATKHFLLKVIISDKDNRKAVVKEIREQNPNKAGIPSAGFKENDNGGEKKNNDESKYSEKNENYFLDDKEEPLPDTKTKQENYVKVNDMENVQEAKATHANKAHGNEILSDKITTNRKSVERISDTFSFENASELFSGDSNKLSNRDKNELKSILLADLIQEWINAENHHERKQQVSSQEEKLEKLQRMTTRMRKREHMTKLFVDFLGDLAHKLNLDVYSVADKLINDKDLVSEIDAKNANARHTIPLIPMRFRPFLASLKADLEEEVETAKIIRN